MNSPSAVLPDVQGEQRPRICWVPPSVSSAGEEAIELAQLAGLYLDPWQEFVLASSLGERADGKWAAFEVGLCIPRQNGKDSTIEARELAGLFLLGERLITHSAHQFDTSLEHFRRILFLIENTPELDRRVQRVSRSHGEEGIELKGGQRIRFRTRTSGGGRGFSGDLLILNEAMILPEATMGALFFTLSARPNPQVWYAGSAVDEEVHDHGVAFARVRERGIKGADPKLAYFEWSVDEDTYDTTPSAMATDPVAWAQANPGLGIRIAHEHVAGEQRSLGARTFAVERLGRGYWPPTDGNADRVISDEQWAGCLDADSTIDGRVYFSADITPDRRYGAIGVAGARPDGLGHGEVVDHRPGTGWMVDRLVDVTRRHKSRRVVIDASGPAASLIPALEERGIKVIQPTAKEHAQACGIFYDAVDQAAMRHLGTPELAQAIVGAVKRPLGEAWGWSRKSSAVDISPLVAVTLAYWAFNARRTRRVQVISLEDALRAARKADEEGQGDG